MYDNRTYNGNSFIGHSVVLQYVTHRSEVPKLVGTQTWRNNMQINVWHQLPPQASINHVGNTGHSHLLCLETCKTQEHQTAFSAAYWQTYDQMTINGQKNRSYIYTVLQFQNILTALHVTYKPDHFCFFCVCYFIYIWSSVSPTVILGGRPALPTAPPTPLEAQVHFI